jgi:hypothetical protein
MKKAKNAILGGKRCKKQEGKRELCFPAFVVFFTFRLSNS